MKPGRKILSSFRFRQTTNITKHFFKRRIINIDINNQITVYAVLILLIGQKPTYFNDEYYFIQNKNHRKFFLFGFFAGFLPKK